MIPRVRGMFWVAIQIILLVAWFVLLILDKPLVLNDTLRFVLEAAGAALAVAGVVLVAFGVYDLGRNLTPLPDPKPDSSAVMSGIYRWVRHPIYGGIILVVMGVTLLFLTVYGLAFMVAITIFFYAKSQYEERKLRDRYPEYESYAASSKRFIPYLW